MDPEELICLASFLGERVNLGLLSEIAHETPITDLRYADCKSFEITSTDFLQNLSLAKRVRMPQSLAVHWTSQNVELVTAVFLLEDRLVGVQLHKYRSLPHGAFFETAPIRMELYFARKLLKHITNITEKKRVTDESSGYDVTRKNEMEGKK